MVYCTECGEQNPEDAEFCVKCGASLYPGRTYGRSWRRPERGMCFGVPISSQIWGIIIGLIIILWGLSHMMGMRFNLFAIFAVILGVIILMGALRRTSSR